MQQPWTHSYPPVHGQPSMTNGTVIHSGMEPNPLLFNSLSAAYYRQQPQQATTMSSNPNPFGIPTLSFPVEQSGSARPFLSNAYPASYSVQQFHPSGAGSQSMQIPHQSMQYAPTYPYLSPQMVQTINSSFNQCQTIPTQQQSLQLQSFYSGKHFGSLVYGPLRKNRPIITSKTNLYVTGLSPSDNDDTLRSLVESAIQPKSCKAMMQNDKCKGYGFIDCATEEDAEKAKVHIENYRSPAGNRLSVKYAYENEKDAHNVYVRNLPKSCDFSKTQLETLFKCWGNITSAKILEKESGPGVGFVRFSTETEAANAIEGMNRSKRLMPGNDKPVLCKLADKADPGRRSLAATRASQAGGIGRVQIPLTNHYLRNHNSTSSTTSAMPPSSAYPYSMSSKHINLYLHDMEDAIRGETANLQTYYDPTSCLINSDPSSSSVPQSIDLSKSDQTQGLTSSGSTDINSIAEQMNNTSIGSNHDESYGIVASVATENSQSPHQTIESNSNGTSESQTHQDVDQCSHAISGNQFGAAHYSNHNNGSSVELSETSKSDDLQHDIQIPKSDQPKIESIDCVEPDTSSPASQNDKSANC